MLSLTGAVPARRFAAVRTGLEAALRFLDRHAAFLLPLPVAVLAAAVIPWARRPLWYDELFTYYVATAPTLEKFFDLLLHADLNPPLGYLPVMASHALFGHAPLATRLPSAAAFLLAGFILFVLVRRRLGGLFALGATALLWTGFFLYYAMEARPYALLLLLSCLSLLCWQRAMKDGARPAAYWALGACVAALLLTHCFSPLLLAPLLAAEAVRSYSARKLDRRMWAALLVPLPLVLTYVPLFLGERAAIVYPTFFRGSWTTFAGFYRVLIWDRGPLLLLGILALALMRRPPGSPSARSLFAPHETAFALAALAAPGALILYSIGARMSFFYRYGIGACLGVALLVTFFVAHKTNRNLWAAGLFAALALANSWRQSVDWASLTGAPESQVSTAYREVHPDWPFVAANGITFLAMDHAEPPEMVARLYYLTDREASIRYTGGNSFEWFPALCKQFPVRAHLAAYREFVVRHDRFLVLGKPDAPYNWLLRKLQDDGAELRLIIKLHTDYQEGHLYEVRIPRAGAP
ncbi:MAG: glycosyltransferase family 39 protein [Bryobacteraceae bacterium]|jgi:hypothetical protein